MNFFRHTPRTNRKHWLMALLLGVLSLSGGPNARADEPCGEWAHAGWGPAPTVVWSLDSNGDPQATVGQVREFCSWEDPCEGTTKDMEEHLRNYALVSDQMVQISGANFERRYQWIALPGCSGGFPNLLSSQSTMPVHWSIGSAISGGSVNGNASRTIAPGKSIGISVQSATDIDDWSVRGGYTGQAGDYITYSWTASGGTFNGFTNRQGAQWNAPLTAGTYTLTCTIDDVGAISYGDLGSRDDAAITRQITVVVAEDNGAKEWAVSSDITGGFSYFSNADVNTEGVLAVGVTGATDEDHWTRGTNSEDVADTVTYTWTATAGAFTSANSRTTQWEAPQTPGTYTLTCTIDDMAVMEPGDTGSRDDEAVIRQVTVIVTEDENGRDWTLKTGITGGVLSQSSAEVAPTETLDISVAEAFDVDHWTRDEDEGDTADTVTYLWTATGGLFTGSIDGRTAQWEAPIGTGTYTLSCTIDDEATMGPHDSGSRDDEAVVRRITVTVRNETGLSISSDRTAISAGGWNEANGFHYLRKIEGQTGGTDTVRGARPDPHIATITATYKNNTGAPLSGQTVDFSWTMPGPLGAQSGSAVTDANGKATIIVISGDEPTSYFDEATQQWSDVGPVEVVASSGPFNETQKLDVVTPKVEWQYKDEDGNYVPWDGETWALFADERKDIPLRAVLSHSGEAIVGHSMSWGFLKIYDKAGVELLPSDPEYGSYGTMSGAVSTSTTAGNATATFTRGHNYGRIIFRIEDGNIKIPDGASSLKSAKFGAFASGYRANKISIQRGKSHDAYRWTAHKKPAYWEPGQLGEGTPKHTTPYSYPAPSGEEDNELLPETLTLLRNTLPRESMTGQRQQVTPDSLPGHPDFMPQDGDWWIAQAVGDDPDSETTHFADIKYQGRLYGGAFDIVLTSTPIFKRRREANGTFINSARPEFKSYVNKLRQAGFVAWHRWAGEYNPSSSFTIGSPASIENEIHCIDPAMPNLKSYLDRQRRGYRSGWANVSSGSGYLLDFPISLDPTVGDVAKMDARHTLKSTLNSKYSGWTRAPRPR
jgi:hypothetical protein